MCVNASIYCPCTCVCVCMVFAVDMVKDSAESEKSHRFPCTSRKGGEKLKGAAAMIQSKLEYAIASHSTDWGSALEALDACVEKNEGSAAKKSRGYVS